MAYTQSFRRRGGFPFPRSGQADQSAACSAPLWAAPTPEEAAVFGALPFSDDVLEGEETPLAAPLTEGDLREGHALPRLLAAAA